MDSWGTLVGVSVWSLWSVRFLRFLLVLASLLWLIRFGWRRTFTPWQSLWFFCYFVCPGFLQLLFPFYLVLPFTTRCLDLLWFLHSKQIMFFFTICFEITFSLFWNVLSLFQNNKKGRSNYIVFIFCQSEQCIHLLAMHQNALWEFKAKFSVVIIPTVSHFIFGSTGLLAMKI